MAEALLIVCILVFSLRGYVLGLRGVIARWIGLICAYYLALHYRQPLAQWVKSQWALSSAELMLQILCGAALFFATLIAVSLTVNLLFKLIASAIPATRALLEKKSLFDRLSGAAGNALLGGLAFLLALWAYDFFRAAPAQGTLQQLANRVGNTFLSAFQQHSHWQLQRHQQQQSVSRSEQGMEQRYQGSAVIVSSSDPSKVMRLETTRQYQAPRVQTQALDTATGSAIDQLALQLQGSGNPEDLKTLLENPALQDMALQQLQQNPQLLREMMDNPQLQALAKKLQQQWQQQTQH